MNTLNNIHALVDIDPQKAQTSILQLSKLMRYVLYDATKNLVPLQQDIDFVSNYIRLMRIRYSDKVAIETDIREPMPDRQIPPLLFISFVENAFKHGISYENESFIQLSIHTDDDKLHFSCRNSKKRTEKPEKADKGGVGIKNTRQRLDLIYGTDYQLDIRDDDNDYTVSLTIPLTS
ncbi:sensor histidine kinase [Prevotella sp. Rep29]|uniref:sensor histidine kinase n=1 Tax=Prevotella sp. Rep29 TaxID=2691580 RepID=UPI001C6EEAE6|nr:histidine kinase [Prevotella sp. Rep29]QYR11450.1 GHKL domain-containing protein [Prevotella sp. Rep29]